jgi:MFS family permease
MTYPSLHTFVGSTVPSSGQTMAFSWVSNVQLASGAFVSLVAGVFSDVVGIQFPFILTGVLALAVFLFYAPRSPEFFGPVESASSEPLVTHEGTV